MADGSSHTPAVGQPLPRVEGRLKVTGRARYAAEFAPPGLAYAAVVESTIPAGRIAAIDAAEAERAPGVLLVLTHENADRLAYEQPKERPAVDPVSGEQLRALQDAEVKFSGQPVGVVVAATQAQAEYGASLVRVTYARDPAPHTRFDPALGMPTSDAAAKKGRGPESTWGDPDGALAAAPVRVDHTYVQPREHHQAMEPHAAVARWEGDRLTLWSKTQWVGNERDAIALVFGIPAEHVRVINPFVGGAFGSALRTWPHVTLAALAARRAGRPVRLELTRRQLATSVGFRPRAEQRVALGADRAGRLLAVVHEAVAQTSTYEEFADATLDAAASTYACADRRTRYRLVPMHTNTPCPMRGPGHVTGLFAQEVAMDELAAALGLDPVELRLRNYAERHPGKDLPWSSKRLRECYALGAARFGWGARNPAPRAARDGRDLVGYGMATALNPAPRYPTSASATLFADGTAVVRCATSDMGPGTYTAATQVAADALGLPMARVRFELGDTAFPAAKEHGGSTTTASIGPAVQAACRALRAKLDDLARSRGDRAADAADGAADPAALLRRAGLARLDADGSAGPGGDAKAYAIYGFGAVFAEVRVDPDLGTVRVARVVGAYDAGHVVNPRLAHSQCLGGMVQGIGMALTEDAGWDPRHGRATNATLADYHVPVCASVGALDALFVPGKDPVASPLGTKGLAELGLCGVAPAVANAVWHATGVRVRELPITPDKLLTA
ncbi:acrylaldehyde oxidase [Gemmatimonadetes bacterium T265]|nr:acrylaldehyde oxidase [Gemmatimonadetes bacterium T265]